MPEEHLYRSMLLDYYGDLLTARQRECYDLHYNEDLSLSEIAEQFGISRQGAWDNIRRASDTMENLEEKTGLIHRRQETDCRLQRVFALLDRLEAKVREGALPPGMTAELRVFCIRRKRKSAPCCRPETEGQSQVAFSGLN